MYNVLRICVRSVYTYKRLYIKMILLFCSALSVSVIRGMWRSFKNVACKSLLFSPLFLIHSSLYTQTLRYIKYYKYVFACLSGIRAFGLNYKITFKNTVMYSMLQQYQYMDVRLTRAFDRCNVHCVFFPLKNITFYR